MKRKPNLSLEDRVERLEKTIRFDADEKEEKKQAKAEKAAAHARYEKREDALIKKAHQEMCPVGYRLLRSVSVYRSYQKEKDTDLFTIARKAAAKQYGRRYELKVVPAMKDSRNWGGDDDDEINLIESDDTFVVYGKPRDEIAMGHICPACGGIGFIDDLTALEDLQGEIEDFEGSVQWN